MEINWGIIGHDHIISLLDHEIKNDTLAHTYMFAGPKGLGKTTVAKKFAKAILQTDQALLAHPDFIFCAAAEGRKEISVREIRAVIHRMHITSSSKYGTVVIIDDAEDLSISATNALLKILEEPSGKSAVILVTSHKARVPKTIISRARVIHFRPVPRETLYLALKEQYGLSTPEASQYIHESLGKPAKLTLWLKEKKSWEDYKARVDEVIAVVSKAPVERFAHLKNKNAKMTIDQVQDAAYMIESVARDILLMRSDKSATIQHEARKEILRQISQKAQVSDWLNALRRIKIATELLKMNASPQAVYENILLAVP